jgi:hypothetical protein
VRAPLRAFAVSSDVKPHQAFDDERLSLHSSGESDSSFCKGWVKVAAPGRFDRTTPLSARSRTAMQAPTTCAWRYAEFAANLFSVWVGSG